MNIMIVVVIPLATCSRGLRSEWQPWNG